MAALHVRWSRRAIVRLLSAATVFTAVATVGFGSAAAAAGKTPPGDPPGNNGTIKIVASDPSDFDPGNEPMIDNGSCMVWLEFYGFDTNQTADITFFAQAPSGDGQILLPDKNVLISDDAAGGGQDRDEVIGYNLTTAVEGLQAHPKHGYHIKVTSDSLGAPGGAKQKVFWINCAPQPLTTLKITKAVQGAGAGPFPFQLRCNHHPLDSTFTLAAGATREVTGVPAGTTCVVNETDTKGALRTDVVETPSDGRPDGQVKLLAGTPATLVFTNVFPGGAAAFGTAAGTAAAPAGATGPTALAAPAPAVLGATQRNPATVADLPRTGAEPAPLAATGLWSLSAGGVALAGARRRRRRS